MLKTLMLSSFMGRLPALIALVVLIAFAAPELRAQQVNPTESAVQEEQLMQALQSGQSVQGRVTIPDARAGDLIRPDNSSWAAQQIGWVTTLNVVLIVGVLALLVAFYLFRGRIRVPGGFSGRTVQRFNAVERFAHWLMAVTFIVLALTGLNLLIGTAVVRPIVGESAFGTLSSWGKIAHNYVAWPYMFALAGVFVMWVLQNLPSKVDAEWFKQGGGLLSDGAHPPARKFNAGQKVMFWAVVLGGAALSYTGVMLLFPEWAGTAADWQFYQVIHAIAAGILTAIVLGHIYIGTVGMEGAFDAMGTGQVDENWARAHHAIWVEEMKGHTTSAPAKDREPAKAPDKAPAPAA
jgi:formate dehydrogenase subunit gamma